FFENQIAPIPKDYNLFFSELYINDELITPTNSNNVLEFTLPYQQEIELTNNQNYFTIKFAASNYIKANKIVYEYKLEGLTDKWIQTSEQSIKYTNLSPGSYILHVRELQKNNPTATLKEIQLKISVLPPFYASIYAYLLYALIFAFALRKIITFNKSKILLSTSLEYEIRENDRIKELNQTKLQFFTNISHEFRTPLTLIIGQIESMAQMENITPVIHNKIVKIYKNASHLRNLITELLDFRKQERDLLALKVTNQDIVGFTRNIYLAFNEMALTRKIDFNFSYK
ncbi:hybrid sensor histidine kinase/response regulator, partial [bacterium]|nr:hybrid sensor histidine kinase/response regulator [bacterium]